MRILVVEDDEGIAHGLKHSLTQHGHAVDLCFEVESAWSALAAEPFDAVLLDLGLPDGDGQAVLQRLRAAQPARRPLPDPSTPVLIMTARDQVSDRIAGLDLGADDYLVKPFDYGELEARLRAMARRAAGRARPLLTYGELVVDPAARSISRAGVSVDLATREFDLLQALLEAQGRVLSRQQLEARLYAWDSAVESNTIEVHVHHLRRKLGSALIQTMRGVGYFVPREAVR